MQGQASLAINFIYVVYYRAGALPSLTYGLKDVSNNIFIFLKVARGQEGDIEACSPKLNEFTWKQITLTSTWIHFP